MLRLLVEAALLPFQAWLSLDAMTRVFYRRYISHRRLLEWTSAQVMHRRAQSKVPVFLLSMSLVSLLSMMIGWAVGHWRPVNIWVISPWLIFWFLSPLIGWLLNRRPLLKQPQSQLPAEDRQFLRNIARRTWRYFSDFVNEETSWLPPDNYQVSHQKKLALRTSPTNIGLYMVSVISTHEFGYLTLDEVIFKLTRTMETIDKLERYEGHLLNWYDIQSLASLKPQYVSAVDSGNLLGALWVLDQWLKTHLKAPLLDLETFAGLRDTGEVLRQVCREDKIPDLNVQSLDELLHMCKSPPDSITDALSLLRQAEGRVRDLSEKVRGSSAVQGKVAYWTGQLQSQLAALLSVADRYFIWIEILAEKTEEDIAKLDPGALPSFRQALHRVPSLLSLAHGQIPCIAILR
jgi:cyclic beta-1,2-glucan synthetase